MKIPQQVQLAGLTIDVVICPLLHADKGLGGYSDYPGQRILIAGDIGREMQEISYLHECLHFCFLVMGEDELRKNEKIVDLLAHFLHQLRKAEEK